MTELINREAVARADELAIPGIDGKVMLRIGRAQRLASQEKKRLAEKLGMPSWIDRTLLPNYLPERVLAEIKGGEFGLSIDWEDYLRLFNKELGYLLVDGVPVSDFNSSPEFGEWFDFGAVLIKKTGDKGPLHDSVQWKMKPDSGSGLVYPFPLDRMTKPVIIPETEAELPLNKEKIFVFGENSFVLVDTTEPWER